MALNKKEITEYWNNCDIEQLRTIQRHHPCWSKEWHMSKGTVDDRRKFLLEHFDCLPAEDVEEFTLCSMPPKYCDPARYGSSVRTTASKTTEEPASFARRRNIIFGDFENEENSDDDDLQFEIQKRLKAEDRANALEAQLEEYVLRVQQLNEKYEASRLSHEAAAELWEKQQKKLQEEKERMQKIIIKNHN